MTKAKALPKAQSETLTWLPLDIYSGDGEFDTDRTSTCCGVLELGNFQTMKNAFRNFKVSSKETKAESYVDHVWVTGSYGYKTVTRERQVPSSTRSATYEEVLEAFRHEQDKIWPKEYGLGVAYLLPCQQNGDWGRLLEDLGWTDLGRFWNPKTRHTLHHWVCTFRKGPPGKKKSSKSILQRG